MDGNDYRLKRFFEYSRASRYRIRRALRNARAGENVSSSSSSETDGEGDYRPPQRRANAGNHRRNESSSQSSNLSDSDEDVFVEGAAVLNGSSDTSSENEDDASVVGQDGEDRNPRAEFPHLQGPDDQQTDSEDLEPVGLSHSENSGEEEEEVVDYNEGQQQEEESDGEANAEANFGNEWNGPYNEEQHVYELAPITLGESMYSILSFFLRHNLPQVCLSDLLGLIDLHCRSEGNLFPKSVHNFKKFFHNIQFPLVRRFYCSVCLQRVNNLQNVCTNCNEATGLEFYLEISILSQLKALYKRPGFREKLNHRFQRRKFNADNYEDIYDGELYKELCVNDGILANGSNISLMWYTDGVSVFRSSKYELWPFYLTINELPYNERTKVANAMLAGLWFGKQKPVASTFLESMHHDILQLRAGIRVQFGNPVETMTVRGIVVGGTADLPAKATFLNFKYFNARHGCCKCKIRSQNLRRGLNVFPYRRNLQLRTTAETLRFAQEAMELPLFNGLRQDVYGVKGPSILSTFVHQYVESTAVDVMHCAYSNIAKNLLTFWFDRQYDDRDFSLYNNKRLVNERLSKITPPNFVQRISRTLDFVKYWKAHEFKAFLFYYSLPVLIDLLPELFLDHHKLLVLGLFLLNQRSVSQDMVALASDLLHEYVSQFENLYGLEFMTNNLHQLLHLPNVASNLGPLWVTSCFPYESLNGKLKKLVKGTRYAELQVCSGVSMLMKLAELKQKIPQDGSAFKFCENMFDSNRGRKLTNIGNSMAIVGKYLKKNDVPQLVRQSLNRSNIVGENFYEFHRLKKYSLVYVSEQYGRVVKTKSYCVKYSSGGIEGLGYIDRFLRVTNCDCPNFCFNCDPKYIALIRECQETVDLSAWEGAELHFFHTLHGFGDLVAVDTSNIISMCFVITVADRNSTYLIEPVNLIEAE